MSLPTFCVRLAIAGALLCACSLNTSSTEGEQADAAAPTEPSTAQLPPSSTQSTSPPKTSTDASVEINPDGGTSGDAGGSDGGKKVTDAAADAHPDTGALLPHGSPCLSSTQCAGGLCLPFRDKGLRCTKACTKDNDCPNNKDCGDNPAVCEI